MPFRKKEVPPVVVPEPTPAEQYLAATREWHEADAAMTKLIAEGADADTFAEAQQRLKRAENTRMLMERYADQVDDAEVAKITGTGVHGITAKISTAQKPVL